jgi:cytochrome c oxidase assembly protein subunit 15
MFFVFVIPFFWFLWRGMLSRPLLPRLLIVVALAGLEGFLGWIMVASGLIKRPWVNAYNLTLHLTMALIIFSYLFWTYLTTRQPEGGAGVHGSLRRFAWGMVVLAFFQIALGAMMSGTKAGLFYPTWPDMQGSYLPDVLLQGGNWQSAHFIDYDVHPFMSALIQFLHRNTAYLLTALLVVLGVRLRRGQAASAPVGGNSRIRSAVWVTWSLLGVQVLLGIFTLLACQGSVPVLLGVLHQAGAVLLLTSILYLTYQCRAAAQRLSDV